LTAHEPFAQIDQRQPFGIFCPWSIFNLINMAKIETYSDNEGNSIVIETDPDGVTVSASIKTKPQYTGGSSASAASSYAHKYGLTKQ
jgi:hypothetical protein